jgi:hypothetical protein
MTINNAYAQYHFVGIFVRRLNNVTTLTTGVNFRLQKLN